MKKVRFFLEFVILSWLGYVVRMLPRKGVLFLGARLGDFAYYCVPIRKKLTIAHLKHSFPEKSSREISDLARRVYRNLGMNGLEHLCLPGLTRDDLLEIVCLENEDVLESAFSRKKGVIFVGGHFGNWTYAGGAVSSKGYPLTSVVAGIQNPYIEKLINDHRKDTGMELLQKGMSIRGILTTLRKNASMAMLMDQDAGRNGIFVDFFGRPCSTPKGPALFALKTGAAMVFFSSIRQPNGSIKVLFEEIDVDHSKGASDENIHDIMQRCTAKLELYTKQYPDHWFWVHRRWKTTP